MENRRYRDKLKVIKVIESCTTIDQLLAANNMIIAYDTTYDTCSDLLDFTYFKQAGVLQTKPEAYK